MFLLDLVLYYYIKTKIHTIYGDIFSSASSIGLHTSEGLPGVQSYWKMDDLQVLVCNTTLLSHYFAAFSYWDFEALSMATCGERPEDW